MVMAAAATGTQVGNTLTGTVVDAGDGVTHIIPVADGYVIGSCIKHIPIAGRDITNFIQLLLREREQTIPADEAMDVAKRIKEKYCYVCPDMAKEFKKYDEDPGKWVKQYAAEWRGSRFQCDVAYERFLGPEIFFNPEIFKAEYNTPLTDLVYDSVLACPIDCRKQLV